MGFFDWLFGKRAEVPPWSPFRTAARHAAFESAVAADLRGRGLSPALSEGTVRLQGRKEVFGLQNLAQVCAGAEDAEWSGIIGRHFDPFFKTGDRELAVELGRSFEAARSHLRPRLFPAELLEQKQHFVLRPVAEGLEAALCLDLPETVATLPRREMEGWGVSEEQVWAAALENVRTEDLPPRRLDLAEGRVAAWGWSAASFFVASRVMLLEQLVDTVPELGALVIVPTRHALVVHPITGPEVQEAVQHLVPLAALMHKEGPGSITASLYWVRGGRVIRLPAWIEEDRLRFEPPPEFVRDVLQRVAKGPPALAEA